MTTKIIIADDHKMMRDGLRALIEKKPGFEIVAEAENGLKVLELVRKHLPELIIMDIGMPDINGIEATRKIISEYPDIKIIALSMHSDKRFITRMLEAGASGYLMKDCAFDELIQAIQSVLMNQMFISKSIANIIIKDHIKRLSETDSSGYSILTDREREVIQMLAEGNSTKEIASHLHLSVKTVETHRINIMKKLNLHSVAELTKYAIREGITTLES